MDIEISRDLQHYKESFLMGLTVKQFTFSVLSWGRERELYSVYTIKSA